MKTHPDALPDYRRLTHGANSLVAVAAQRLRSTSSALIFACVAITAGSFDLALLIGWHNIDPRNLDWLDGDPAVYQAGWEFLRHQHWSFPPAWIAHLDFPFGVSAALLDVIPVVALPLKLIEKYLPANFQYLGLYVLLCYILQAFYGLRLVSLFVADRIVIFIGGLIFLNSPVLLARLNGHFSLSSQWLIVAAFYYYFRVPTRGALTGYASPLAALAIIAGGVSPYIAVMVVLIGLTAILRSFFRTRQDSSDLDLIEIGASGTGRPALSRSKASTSLNHALAVLTLIGVTATSLLLFGFIAVGSGQKFEGIDYTKYSMNLLSLLNPPGGDPYFDFLQVFPRQRFEGNNYLGLGIILLGIMSTIRRPALIADLWSPAVRPLLLLSAICTLLALSTTISLGQRILITMPVPSWIFHALAIFRASGRFFWPVHYLLLLGVIVGATTAFCAPWSRRAVFAVTLLVQYIDSIPIRDGLNAHARITHLNPLMAREWETIGKLHKHLIILPAWQCGLDRTPGGGASWPWFARLAARSGMTLNSVHSARPSSASKSFNCTKLPKQLLSRGPEKDSAYILDDRLALSLVSHYSSTHFCRRIDGFNLCTFDPRQAPLSLLLPEQILPPGILPPYVCGTQFRADQASPKSMFMTGWDLREAPAIWTVGREAAIYIRPLLPPRGDLRLEMTFAGQGALLTATHPRQRAFVTADGYPVGTMEFNLGRAYNDRAITIPRRFVRDNRIVEILFELPDAVAPSDLRINIDGRLLALHVSRIRVNCVQ